MKNKAGYCLLLFFWSLNFIIISNTPYLAKTGGHELSAHLYSLLYPEELTNAFWGAALFDLEEDVLLFSENYNKSIIPASNQKLLITAVALDRLGADFNYQTCIYFDAAAIEQEVLIGDIYIRGMGDPSFAGRFYDDKSSLDLMENLVENIFIHNNIRGLDGQIVADVSFFSDRGVERTWENEDLSYWYAAASDALNFNENIITYEISASDEGDLELSMEPDTDYLSFDLQVTTNRENRTTVSYYRDDNKVVHVTGNVRPGESISRRVNVAEPADYFLYVFKSVAENKGVDLSRASFVIDDSSEIDYDGLSLVYSHLSSPMKEIIDLINKASHNLYADAVLKTLGQMEKSDGSFSAGGRVISEVFEEWGIESLGMYVQDGSGLSRRNLVTPQLLIELMIYMHGSPYFEDWLTSLPRAGRDGTLRQRFRDRDIQGNVYAKTGFINKVRALSGYIIIDEQPRYAFVLICNNYLTTTGFINQIQEKFCQEVWEWHFLNEREQ